MLLFGPRSTFLLELSLFWPSRFAIFGSYYIYFICTWPIQKQAEKLESRKRKDEGVGDVEKLILKG